MEETHYTNEKIIDDLRYFTRKFPKTALKMAIERQQEITPLLLNVLQDAVQHGQSLTMDDMGHLYSMFLLAQFREKTACCDLHPAEVYGEIKAAFERDMVDPFCIDMTWVDSVLAMAQEDALEKHLTHHYKYIYDTIEEMEWWTCFEGQKPNKHDHLLRTLLKPYKPYQLISVDHQKKSKLGRNDPRPFGSNKKFKKCCLPHSNPN